MSDMLVMHEKTTHNIESFDSSEFTEKNSETGYYSIVHEM